MVSWISPWALKRRGILGMNRRNCSYILRYNDRTRFPLVDNKLKTKLITRQAGLNAPQLLQVIRHQTEIERIEELLGEQPSFVIKPAQGSGGKGILVITGRAGADYLKSSGNVITQTDLKRHLSNTLSGLHSLGGKPDFAIIETLVVSTPSLAEHSYEGVPDIRLIVFKGYPVMGMLRLATEDSDGKANLHQGAIGVGLDIATGRGIAAVQYNRPLLRHPDTGTEITHIEIPHWQELLRLAARCYEVTGLGYLGCDIVLDEHRGPLLLELNARPGLSIQLANNAGLLPRLRLIESQPMFAATVDERITFAMRHFGVADGPQQASLFAAPKDNTADSDPAEPDARAAG
ncbi:MAG: alpha-L-glutamate ligase-like protein [Pseudomonadota bacterium]